MNCACKPFAGHFVVDDACVAEMHRDRPPAEHGTPDQWVAADSMFNLGIYTPMGEGFVFECGCAGIPDPQAPGGFGWSVSRACLRRRHPEMAA